MKKKLRFLTRIVSMALVIAMLTESFLGSGNIVLAAEQEEIEITNGADSDNLEEAQGENVNSSEGEEFNTENLDILFEVEENRERTSKHFRLSDGTIMAADYGMDIHYEEDGQWKDIDNRFVYESPTAEDSMEGFATAEGSVEFKFAPDTGDGEVVRATTGDYSVGFEFLADVVSTQEGSDTSLVQMEDSIRIENTDLSNEEITSVSEEQSLEAADNTVGETTEMEPVPITFIKGDILNEAEVTQILGEAEIQMETASSYAANPVSIAEAENTVDEKAEVVWADAGTAHNDGEERSLMEQASLENAVTSVGYGNVKPGVSLQYIASGSSLKEYILLSERQDSYVYTFEMNLGNLEAEKQEDGSILLSAPADGKVVYEIPASYMTDAAGAYSDEVAMELAEAGDGRYILTLIADAAWIDAEERVFPVQIDPTLNVIMEISDNNGNNNIRGFYAIEGKDSCEEVTTNYKEMIVGFDSGGEEERITYIQLRNLVDIPKNSVICGAKFYFYAWNCTQIGWPRLHVDLREVTSTTTWDGSYTWSTKPAADGPVLDTRTFTEQTSGYVGWDITGLIKKHYENGNRTGQITAFQLRANGGETMDYGHCANVWLEFRHTSVDPVFQIFYRDTKGIEDYYTYQVQSVGNAGTAYIGDYNGQLILAKTLVSYESTAMPYSLGVVYNSSYDSTYFTSSGNIQTKDFSKMRLGRGWKLTAQETITELALADLGTTTNYLVYNDSDGTEHYFKQKEAGSSVYEDEDGLNLTITKSGNDYTMKDKKDNLKVFTNGYLTRIEDANGNKIHIVYNGGSYSANSINSDADSNRITSIESQPVGSAAAKVIFKFGYDGNDCLSEIKYTDDDNILRNKVQLSYSASGGYYYLAGINYYDSSAKTYKTMAQYQYRSDTDPSGKKHCYSLSKIYDTESGYGMEYTCYWTATGYRVYTFQEFAADDINGTGRSNGELVRSYSPYLGNSRYRSAGSDGILKEDNNTTTDDVVTVYLFNSAGQTVNVQSEDQEGNLLGVSASAYENKNGTSKKNHRMTAAVSSGQAGVNLLSNGGFERDTGSDGTADGWNHNLSGNSNAACRGTDSGVNHSGKMHYNFYNQDLNSTSGVYRTVSLVKGEVYTLSAYINTSAAYEIAENGGFYMQVYVPGMYPIAQSPVFSYKTDGKVDGGWQRVSVTFTSNGTGEYTCFLTWENANGLIVVDDVQLEKGGAATRFNHVYNGSFEEGSDGWELSSGTVCVSSEKKHGSGSVKLTGAPETIVTATQEIPIRKSAAATFLLSGWSKGNSIADLDSEAAEKPDDKEVRFWGITLTLNYTDGTKDHYNLPFSTHVTDWQYAAMAVTPKDASKTIDTATLKLNYRNNANIAYFDSISLIEEPSQTYTYDDEGNLKSVKSSGNDETYGYNGSTQNLMSIATEGSGTYKYEYDEKKETVKNVHLPIRVTNDTVTMDISYTEQGESKETVLRKSDNTGKKMSSSSEYADGLLKNVTDSAGSATSYTYYADRSLRSVTDASGQSVYTNYDPLAGRVKQTYQSGLISVAYAYQDGNLSSITRGGFFEEGDTDKQEQYYRFTYDDWGNRTGVFIGKNSEIPLASYEYDHEDAYIPLEKVSYGDPSDPLATISYSYDKLGRVTDTVYVNSNSSDTVVYGYQYGSDGSLSGVEKNGKLVYTYDYDTLGRLIHSSQLDESGNMVLYTDHEYDTSDRIKSQGWQIGSDAFEEAYSYNSADGTLSTMTVDNEELAFSYDGLKRLDSRTLSHTEGGTKTGVVTVDYSYRDLPADNKTTIQVESIKYLKAGSTTQKLMPEIAYSYDARGNIATVEVDGRNAIEYTYDKQNQLIRETEGNVQNTYVYDTYGNIRNITTQQLGVGDKNTTKSYTMTYDDSGVWKDRLTKVTYTGYDGTSVSGNLTYDEIGNPLTYFNGKKNWNFTWKYGRQLASATDGTNTITNTYDVDGIRETKTVNGVEHKYVTLDGKIIRETYGNVTVDYFYDNAGSPFKIEVNDNGTVYTGYYVLNQQGDVIGILDADGNVLAEYYYNAWGLEVSKILANRSTTKSIKDYNALKYRGYYYDAESGFYYVSSRYYDPVIGRFISPDDVDTLTAGHQNFMQYNLYTYCWNNPLNMSDENGDWPSWASAVAGVAVIAGLAVATAMTGGAVGVICGAALTGAVAGGGIGAGIGYAVGGIDGALNGFGIGTAVGGAVGAALAGANIATGGVQIVGSAQKTGTAFHQMASNIKAGQMAMQPGRYSKITFDRALKTAGLNGRQRPDVIGVARYGKNKLVEVVSKSQTRNQMLNKCANMVKNNPNTRSSVVSWPGRLANFWRNLWK